MNIAQNIEKINTKLTPTNTKLVAVSKTKPAEMIQQAYDTGWRRFGENKVQEMVEKHEALPKDIEWHLIGHLQSNKVKYIAPFVSLVHGVDKAKLLKEVDKQAAKCDRVINCLLQLHIAQEDTKFGLSFAEARDILASEEFVAMKNVCVVGVMGMATFTDDKTQIRNEFRSLKIFFDEIKTEFNHLPNVDLQEVSMGMSGDYEIAIEEGSTMVRVGSAIFGSRVYSNQ
ncbi:YggS family pyridoxal phosphate-dependent enzyme [uncultured Microscilla sp.]|uniref:YggS family pyridoxal phosphate-dependent enzyme n=1 Tax=uncultured Microscilla sp. TaxID=432653 RepID=UPI00261F591B|nr:YggS family pyridoxal phosphate-dependent enzyme [uncultured Microscilla sp.]